MRYFNTVFLQITIFMLLLSACAPLQEPVERTATFSLDEIVARTLEAYARERALTPDNAVLADAPGEEFSVEVTQEAPAEAAAPQEENPPEAAAENAQLPESHYIWDIWGHRQYFPIGCEASAAHDWAWYFGVNVNEFNFQMELPVSDNPDLGFVGSVDGPGDRFRLTPTVCMPRRWRRCCAIITACRPGPPGNLRLRKSKRKLLQTSR